MPRRLIAVTALAAGMSIAAAISLATPALAKGPSQAAITGPGLAGDDGRGLTARGPEPQREADRRRGMARSQGVSR